MIKKHPEQLTELSGHRCGPGGQRSQPSLRPAICRCGKDLCKHVPSGLRDLMTVPGCGPKRAILLHKKLKVDSIDDLRRAAARHAIRRLKGFGTKTEDNILKALEELPETSRRMYLAEAQPYAEAILQHLKNCPGVTQIDMAGSYRRRKETVGDLDILAVCKAAGKVMDRLAHFEGVSQVLAHGRTKSSVRLRNGLQLDLRVVPEASYGAAPAILHRLQAAQHFHPANGNRAWTEDQRIRRISRGAADRGSNRARCLPRRGTALDSAGTARRPQ